MTEWGFTPLATRNACRGAQESASQPTNETNVESADCGWVLGTEFATGWSRQRDQSASQACLPQELPALGFQKSCPKFVYKFRTAPSRGIYRVAKAAACAAFVMMAATSCGRET